MFDSPSAYEDEGGLSNARLRRAGTELGVRYITAALPGIDEERTAFMLRHDTFWV